MKNKIIVLSAVAALATTGFASSNEELALELNLLKEKVELLETRAFENKKIHKKMERSHQKTIKKLNVVKAHGAQDNIKWGVDFRTAMDSIHYTHANGSKSSNPDFLTNRLLLSMAFAPDSNNLFKGKLSYNKAYGDSANHSQSNTQPGYANFDWVTNENATDNTLKVKEAYWLYMNDSLFGADIAWTASMGRRPSTDGLGINLREGMKDNSPLSHTINVEFDGGSAKFDLDQVANIEGMWFKLCAGRGLTNAKPRFQMDGADYAADNTTTDNKDNNMYGFIFVPYDNGQYSIHTNYAIAENLIGFTNSSLGNYMATGTTPSFSNVGDLSLFTAMFKAEGLGNEINDFLDDTRFFASWAQSKTTPNDASQTIINPATGMTEGGMLGSIDSETGTSTWIGIDMPCLLSEDGRLGIEWNKGSKYWRSVTYAEDTMAGSKIAARGTAVEIYYTKPLTKALTLNVRYTKIEYDYTGSQAFFGADGTPMTMAQAQAQGQNPVEKATDARVSISYRF